MAEYTIDKIEYGGNVYKLQDNQSGYITSYTETDPTVPSWAKQPSKPTYTANEVGALPSSTVIPSKTSDLTNDSGFITGYTETDPTVPSWAKQSSKPTYTANEVGALPATTAIPTKTSDLTNDSGFITGYTETDPVFSASAAAGITATDISNWNSKTSNTGTVTSINLISGTGITVSNSNTAITTSGSRTITLNTIKTSKSSSGLGGAQVWKSWENGASITPPSTIGSYTGTFTVQNSTMIANRYYPIEATYDGHLIVNIPWESVPTNISAFTNDSGYLTSYTETDPVFGASAAAGITATDISNWNAKVSDTKTWGDVVAPSSRADTSATRYIPQFSATNSSSTTTATLTLTRVEPFGLGVPKWDNNNYLYAGTPSANDNSTKVATTAYVDAAIPDTSNFLTLADLPIYDGTVE